MTAFGTMPMNDKNIPSLDRSSRKDKTDNQSKTPMIIDAVPFLRFA
jgi:hypothetical protein